LLPSVQALRNIAARASNELAFVNSRRFGTANMIWATSMEQLRVDIASHVVSQDTQN
jgi:hypothetical protein